MSKAPVYRIGDHVRVLRPIVVLRVGYPFDVHAEAARILREHTNDIFALLHKIDPAHVPAPAPSQEEVAARLLETLGMPVALEGLSSTPSEELTHDPLWGVALKLAYQIGAHQQLGGRNRQLWTEERPDLAGRIMAVKAKHTAHTGTYYPPSRGYTYNGDYYDYEPGGLTDRKSHLLLDLTDPDVLGSYAVTIEAINVEPDKE